MSEQDYGIYEGMEIIHLEDFSNLDATINKSYSVPSGTYVAQSPAVVQLSMSDQDSRGLLGDIAQVVYGHTGIYSSGQASSHNYSQNIGSRPGFTVSTYAGRRELRLTTHRVAFNSASRTYWYQSNKPPRIGLWFTLPANYTSRRVILSFDYRPIDWNLTGIGSGGGARIIISDSLALKGGNSATIPEYVEFPNRHLPGKLEFVFESGRLKTYFRNKLIGDRAHNSRNLFFGQWWISGTSGSPSLSAFPTTSTPFAISNLAMVSFPLNSPVNRLGNIRVQKANVNKVDDVAHTATDALNGTRTNDGKSLEVDHNVNTVEFESIELNDGEEIVGAAMTIAGTNTPTGSTINTVVESGETKLVDKNITLIETHLSREDVVDFSLGRHPEDYGDVKLKVRSVEV